VSTKSAVATDAVGVRRLAGSAPSASHFIACATWVGIALGIAHFVPDVRARVLLLVAAALVPYGVVRVLSSLERWSSQRRARRDAALLARTPIAVAIAKGIATSCRGTVTSGGKVTSPAGEERVGYLARSRGTDRDYTLASCVSDLELRTASGEIVNLEGGAWEVLDPFDASVLEGEVWITVGDEITVIGVPEETMVPGDGYRAGETRTVFRPSSSRLSFAPTRARMEAWSFGRTPVWIGPLGLALMASLWNVLPTTPPPRPTPPRAAVHHVRIGDPCGDGESCPFDATCVVRGGTSVCVEDCLGGPCPPGLVCDGTSCIEPRAEHESCGTDTECGAGFLCATGMLREGGDPDESSCERRCASDADCAEGTWCNALGGDTRTSWCQPPDEILPVIRTLLEFERQQRGASPSSSP
jgi:hypothetical protein